MSGSIWNYLVPAAVGVGTALISSNASKSAANTAAAATDRAADVQWDMYSQNRDDLAPYRAAGTQGLQQFQSSIGPSFQQSPGYQFAFDQGVQAIDRGASARGLLGSGARLKELTRYGQGVANQEYGNYQNRLAALSGIGQTATNTGAGLGAQTAQGVGNAIMQGGQAQAQGQTGAANAWLGGANAGVGLYGMMKGWGNVAP